MFEIEWSKYKKMARKSLSQSATLNETRRLENLRSSIWSSFDDQDGNPVWSMVSDSMIKALDKLNEQWVKDEGRYMFVDGDKTDNYWEDVIALLTKYVVKGHPNASSTSVEGIVRDHMLTKVKWYRNEARIDGRLRIPILTGNMLDALAANISGAAVAYEEVSDYYCAFC